MIEAVSTVASHETLMSDKIIINDCPCGTRRQSLSLPLPSSSAALGRSSQMNNQKRTLPSSSSLSWPVHPGLLERARDIVEDQRLVMDASHWLSSLAPLAPKLHLQATQAMMDPSRSRSEKYLILEALKSDLKDKGISVVSPALIGSPKDEKLFLLFAPVLTRVLRQRKQRQLYELVRAVILVCTAKHKERQQGFERHLATCTMRHLRATVDQGTWKAAVRLYLTEHRGTNAERLRLLKH
eukprot:CAMPEP_0194051280 /NCGR_PEP_ID=MMETSP0009_2-20130614/39560_1 /TAXON_ID=210454 /ORGANISM="Grammatophora oceanica, Strain CCMP 410" /LENGTH=239 /DNA_ID=CAMNT_0038698297 /DNA_START=58 /DNA_END=777 /DNA_ORIENTATION=+